MGNWKDRPRRTFRYQKPPWSAIRNYDRDPPLEYWKDGIPLWEKKFCKEIGRVPWGKIVDTKQFIHCHSNVANWDDSACEEAFRNAKRRYWAEINNHQCDNYLPDPDEYIERIDWNPDVNSKLIEELDQAYYDPNASNSTQSDAGLESKNKRSRDSSSVWTEGHNEDGAHEGNLWSRGDQLIENKGKGWSQWNLSDSGKANNDENPWDSSISQTNRGTVDNAWKDNTHQVVNSWKHDEFSSDVRGMMDSAGRERVHQGGVTPWQTKEFATDAAVENGWRNNVHQGGTASWKPKGFASDARNNSWSRHQRGTDNFDHYNRPQNNSYNRNARYLTDRIRPNNQNNEQDWKYRCRYGKRPKDAEFDNTRW